jgi:transposase
MKKQHLKLKETAERYLTELLSKGQVKARIIRRAMALRQLNQGATLQAVAETLKVEHWRVSIWRTKYLENGLDFLQAKPRAGRPVEIDGEQRAKITALACSATPAGRAKWSLQLLADKIVELEFCEGISPSQVRAILKKQPPPASQENVVYRRDDGDIFVPDRAAISGLWSSI